MDILTGCTGNVAAEAVKCTAKPVIRHVGYLFRFKKIVDDLIKAKTDLQLEQQKVQEAIDRAAMNNEIAEKDVERWLINVNQLMEEVQDLENKVQVNLRFCNGWCPDWIRQYKLCKEAIQKTNVVKELLQDKGKFSELTHRAPIPGIEIFSSSDFEVFESRKLAFQQIMEALHDDNNKRIGLHGIGGIGKTTLVNEVYKKVKGLNIFNDIVMTVVSLTPDVRRIQGEIAGCLNLKFEDESDMARASEICLRIKKAEKVLIILDDVWKDVNLEAIGIPSCDDHRGCKMLLTTRSEHICNLMHCQRKIPLNFLLEKESWVLMKKTTGIVDDYPALNDVVIEVVKECKGLPIAIITIGKALIGKSLNDWKAALHELRKSRLVDIEGVDEEKNAYVCIKWSYDQLKSKTKLCFLLCSLFPEDYDIPIDELTRYAMVLEKYEDFHSVIDRMNQVRAAINSLKDSSLLLENFQSGYVKMHDIVRDVGLWIASKGRNEFKLKACNRLERNISFETITAISLMDSKAEKLPNKLVCPRLNILLFGGFQSSENISISFFEGMNYLKVLRLDDIILSSQSLQLLTNLRSLYLKLCDFSDDLSSLGKLKRLETLSFYGCGMASLPNELGELESLKILDLTACHTLKRIPPNVIRRLSQLEALTIDWFFKNWEVEGTTNNLNLSELNSLPHLGMLFIQLNLESLPQGYVFPDWQNFFISINMSTSVYFQPFDTEDNLFCSESKELQIKNLDASSMKAFKNLFRTVERIWIESCETEYIVETIRGNHTVIFANVVELYLENMSYLRRICEDPNQYEIFSNLTILFANECTRLTSLFSPSLARSLKKLKELYLFRCHEMKQIIAEEGMILESHSQPICFPKLKTLQVKDCRKLEHIFPISVARGLPQLESLELEYLPQLKQVFGHENEGDHGDGNNNLLSKVSYLRLMNLGKLDSLGGGNISSVWLSLEELYVMNCPLMSSLTSDVEANLLDLRKFQNLRILYVDRCNAISVVLIQGLLNLEELEIRNCGGLQEVFQLEGHLTREGEQQDVWLIMLKKMCLYHLLELRCIWNGPNILIDMNNLEHLKVIECKNLRYVFTPILASSLRALNFLQIERCEELEHLIVEDEDNGLLSYGDFQPLCFPQLCRVVVDECNKLKCLFDVDDWSAVSFVRMQSWLNLEKLEIGNCERLQEVFKLEGLLTGEGEQQNLLLSRLKEMLLYNLLELRCIWKGLTTLINLNCLTSLKVINCRKLRYLFTPTLASSLQNLNCLEIHSCDELEYLIAKDEENRILSNGDLQPLHFPQLCKVIVNECNKLKFLFPITIVDSLLGLSYLEVQGASQLVELFAHEDEGDAAIQKDVTLPKLNYIALDLLPSLVNFCPMNYHSILPNLRGLIVKSCPNMTTSFTCTPDKTVHINGEVSELDEKEESTGISTISPANKDIAWHASYAD